MRLFGISQSQRWGGRARGFTMVESLLLVAILGLTAATVGQSLSTMTAVAVINNNTLYINDMLLSQMEVLRSSYTSKTVPYSSSQTITTPNGHTYTINSSITTANPGSGTTSNFLELEVSVTLPGGQNTMCTYVSE